MLTIGLLGGMSWESSAESYRRVNELVRDRLGGLHSTRCVLYSVDFAEIEQLQVAGRGALRRPDHRWAAGHRVHDGAGLHRKRLAANDLTVLVPDRAGRARVHQVIYDEL
jgi:aspartate/glutamate racemase